MAKKLANPIAALISMPLQYNYNDNIGSADGHSSMLNIQPVIPIEITEDWNVISRTILTVIDQDNFVGHSGSQFGIGDTIQSLFFSPKTPTANGWIWGAGPVFLIPAASDKLMGTDKWGAGPTSVMLRQEGPWT